MLLEFKKRLCDAIKVLKGEALVNRERMIISMVTDDDKIYKLFDISIRSFYITQQYRLLDHIPGIQLDAPNRGTYHIVIENDNS